MKVTISDHFVNISAAMSDQITGLNPSAQWVILLKMLKLFRTQLTGLKKTKIDQSRSVSDQMIPNSKISVNEQTFQRPIEAQLKQLLFYCVLPHVLCHPAVAWHHPWWDWAKTRSDEFWSDVQGKSIQLQIRILDFQNGSIGV